MSNWTKHYVQPGERVRLEMPHSEVCMHMQVAGKPTLAEITPSGWGAQLYRLDGTPFSAPITTGEAGFYHDLDGIYCYPLPDPLESPMRNYCDCGDYCEWCHPELCQ